MIRLTVIKKHADSSPRKSMAMAKNEDVKK